MSGEFERSLIEIARLISEKKEEVLQEVTECASDYLAYFEANEEEFEERGIDEPEEEEEIKWIGLVNILEKYHYVCERDYKDAKEDFLYFVQNLEGMKRYHLTVDSEWLDEEESVSNWCSILDKKWEEKGICMAAIDIDSDSYVLFPCTITELQALSDCAEQCGYCIDLAQNM